MSEPGTVAERWLPIPGWEGLYSVSDLGRVKSHARHTLSRWGTPAKVRERIMKLSPNPDGYLRVGLSRMGQPHTRIFIHPLVLEVFVGPKPFPEAQACHGDGDRTNNQVTNLRWASRSDNAKDSVRHGTHAGAARTHCPSGHEYAGDNLYVGPKNQRVCRTCHRETARRSRARVAARTAS